MTEEQLEQLKTELSECYQRASEIRKQINEGKLIASGINYENKYIVKTDEAGRDYMIVQTQVQDLDKDKVCLIGLNFYINDSKQYPECAEIYFKGRHTWWFDLDEFLTLEKDNKIKVLDKETFLNEIKGYLKTLEIFITDWINKFI